MNKDKIAIVLRGHIRETFTDSSLHDFFTQIIMLYDIDIYIYTFNIINSGKIYTTNDTVYGGKENMTLVNEHLIMDYFKNMSTHIKKIIIDKNGIASIDNDKKVGNVSKNKYLHMWQSIYNSLHMIDDKNKNEYKYVINMRIDYFQLANKFKNINIAPYSMSRLFKIDIINDFMKNIDLNKKITLLSKPNNGNIKKSRYARTVNIKYNKLCNLKYDADDILYGIDNIFAGKLDYLCHLSKTFVDNINDIFNLFDEIYEELNVYAKHNCGNGAPHEVLLPLYIKNFMG